ncbi:MAG: Uma2 family endonuclease [Planctomycetes bacterium]|nr:Uma2 family endonuclease [Planctomycetota bacterium]
MPIAEYPTSAPPLEETIPARPASVTPEEFLAMENEECFELVDGQLMERHMGAESSMIGMTLGAELVVYNKKTGAGFLFGPDTNYRCFPGRPATMRKPDVSFIRRGRLPNDQAPLGEIKIAPDLAVEVISPNDRYEEVDAKVDEYLSAGVPLVWVVNPRSRSVRVHSAPGGMHYLRESDLLGGGEVLPGFSLRVADLFPAQGAPVAAASA